MADSKLYKNQERKQKYDMLYIYIILHMYINLLFTASFKFTASFHWNIDNGASTAFGATQFYVSQRLYELFDAKKTSLYFCGYQINWSVYIVFSSFNGNNLLIFN